MRIAVMGASGRIGSKLVDRMRADGHEVVAASRSSGVDVLGAGLADALAGADVLVDVINPGSRDAGAVMEFFTAAAGNLVQAARRAGVGHYVVLSIVGADRLPQSGYYRAKVAQERIVAESGIPFSTVRATQFTEFADEIIESMTDGDQVRVPDALIQPIPADEVAATLAQVAVGEPRNGILEIGGPEKITFAQLAREVLARKGDRTRTVIVDPAARYFTTPIGTDSLVIAD